MRFLSKTVAIPQVNWRARENLLRLAVFLVVIGLVLAAFLLRNHLPLSQLGYTSIAISALLSSGSLVLPIPALAAICAASVFLIPFLVAVIAGIAETIGELTGYMLGYSGRNVFRRGRLYTRLERWMQRRGWLVLLMLSAIPNPVFDAAGVAAGALRYPLWGFLSVVLAGKLIKFLILAHACAFGIRWITRLLV
jgi:membrane protein YqaA with SNARE-associated domain